MPNIAVFGYGSLVWRPGFEYESKVVGYIKGYRRVFWQGSTDHRGTPEAPGRTVTLHEEEGAVTWGVAYQLAGTPEEQQETIKYLEWREKQYDVRRLCHVYTADSNHEPAMRDVLVYIATDSPTNVNWLGPAPLPAIARQIATSKGPSGPNVEYLLRLADAMREINIQDPELFLLEMMVKQAMTEQNAGHGKRMEAAELLLENAAKAVALVSTNVAAAAATRAAAAAAGLKSAALQQQTQVTAVVASVD